MTWNDWLAWRAQLDERCHHPIIIYHSQYLGFLVSPSSICLISIGALSGWEVAGGGGRGGEETEHWEGP